MRFVRRCVSSRTCRRDRLGLCDTCATLFLFFFFLHFLQDCISPIRGCCRGSFGTIPLWTVQWIVGRRVGSRSYPLEATKGMDGRTLHPRPPGRRIVLGVFQWYPRGSEDRTMECSHPKPTGVDAIGTGRGTHGGIEKPNPIRGEGGRVGKGWKVPCIHGSTETPRT